MFRDPIALLAYYYYERERRGSSASITLDRVPSTPEQFAASELRWTVACKIMGALYPSEQRVFDLLFYRGWSHRATAEHLGCSRYAMLLEFGNAKAHLREIMQRMEAFDETKVVAKAPAARDDDVRVEKKWIL